MTHEQLVELLKTAAQQTYARHRRRAQAGEIAEREQFQRTLGMDDLIKEIAAQLQPIVAGFDRDTFLRAVYPPPPRKRRRAKP